LSEEKTSIQVYKADKEKMKEYRLTEGEFERDTFKRILAVCGKRLKEITAT